jgi:hypothetical protein
MKICNRISAALAVVCAVGVALPTDVAAQVSDSDFNALKKMVQELNEKVQKLEQDHQQDQKALEQNQKQREQDQQQIQQLKQQVVETEKTATNAQAKAEEVATAQAVHPLPGEGNATHNFTMVGDAEIQFGKVDGQHSAFALADFAPIFLFRARDNVLFEAGFDITLQNNAQASGGGASTTVDLSFAQLDYLFNDYVTFVAGDMLLPLGTYSERSAGWLNKMPDDPLPRDLLPGSGIGAQLRGAVPVGRPGQALTYSVYGVNGPGSLDGTGNSGQLDLGGNVGNLSNGTIGNLHGGPSGGGRLGWFFPLKPHYDLELGVSGQSGVWDNAGNHPWTAAVADAALHVGPNLELKGEYIHTWEGTDDMGTIRPRGWWLQGAYKLAGLNLELPLINNIELVGRYDKSQDGISTKTDRFTLGYVYYFSNTLLFEGDYEFVSSNDPDLDHNRFIFQLSYGF